MVQTQGQIILSTGFKSYNQIPWFKLNAKYL